MCVFFVKKETKILSQRSACEEHVVQKIAEAENTEENLRNVSLKVTI